MAETLSETMVYVTEVTKRLAWAIRHGADDVELYSLLSVTMADPSYEDGSGRRLSTRQHAEALAEMVAASVLMLAHSTLHVFELEGAIPSYLDGPLPPGRS